MHTLVGDVLYAAVDAVALDVVTHAQAACHEGDAVEEVLDEVLHGETETGGEASGDDGDAGLGHLEDDEGDDEVEAPGDDGDDVLGQCQVEGVIRVGALAEVSVELAAGVVEVPEYEPEGGDEAKLEEGDLDEVGQVDEVGEESFLADAVHLEDLGGPVDADEEAADGKDGHEGEVDEVVGPRLGDVLLGDVVVLLVHRHEVVEAGDGGDGGQLEGPPDEDLDAEEGVADPGGDAGDNHHDGGEVGIDDVLQRKLTLVAAHHPQLPHHEEEQQGREDEVEDAVGNEHYTQHDDERSEDHQRGVDVGGMQHLAPFQADVEREEDDLEEPGHGDDEGGAHLDEVAVNHGAHNHHKDGEEGYADDVGEHLALDLRAFAAPATGQQPVEDDVGDAQREGEVEEDEDADEEHGNATPLGVADALGAEGGVLGLAGHAGLAEILGIGGDDTEIVGAAILEDVVLQDLIARLGEGIELAHLLLHAGVVAALGLEVLEEDLQVVANGLGVEEAGPAVGQLLAGEEEGLVLFFFQQFLIDEGSIHRQAQRIYGRAEGVDVGF